MKIASSTESSARVSPRAAAASRASTSIEQTAPAGSSSCPA